MNELALTPYVGRLRSEATAALRAWLAVGEGVELSWRDLGGAGIGEVSATLQAEGQRLDLVLREAAPEAAWQRAGIQLTVRRPGQRDPLADPLARSWLAALAQRFAGDERAADAELLPALQRLRVFSTEGISDDDLRHIERTNVGVSGFLRLGFHCNQRCFICPQGRHWPGAPDEQVWQWLEEFAAQGVKQLTISGGEPTTNSLLVELVRRAAGEHGMWVSLQTNAIAFASSWKVDRLVEAGLGFVFVSLHSADPSVSDAFTRAPGTFDLTVRGIHNALDAGLDVAINCCVEASTVGGLEAHARFVVEQFAEKHPNHTVHHVEYSQPGAYFDRARERESMVGLDAVLPQLTAAARVLREGGVELECTGTCGFPLCMLRDEPELVARQDRDRQHLDARTFAPECEACAVQPFCVGVRREYLELHGGRGLAAFEAVPGA